MSFRDFPFLKEISGGSLKISRRKGWFCIKCHFSIKTCLGLGGTELSITLPFSVTNLQIATDENRKIRNCGLACKLTLLATAS